jgi:hypothetical protein
MVGVGAAPTVIHANDGREVLTTVALNKLLNQGFRIPTFAMWKKTVPNQSANPVPKSASMPV